MLQTASVLFLNNTSYLTRAKQVNYLLLSNLIQNKKQNINFHDSIHGVLGYEPMYKFNN